VANIMGYAAKASSAVGGTPADWPAGWVYPTVASFTLGIGNPAVLTDEAHGLSAGTAIQVWGTVSTASILGARTVYAAPTADTFTLNVNVASASDTSGKWCLASSPLPPGWDYDDLT